MVGLIEPSRYSCMVNATVQFTKLPEKPSSSVFFSIFKRDLSRLFLTKFNSPRAWLILIRKILRQYIARKTIFLVCICRNSFPFKNYSYWLSDSSWLMGYNYRTLFSFKYKQKISISNFKNDYDWGNDCFIAWRINTFLIKGKNLHILEFV